MRNRLHDVDLERLRLHTKVITDALCYHARTPNDESWCGIDHGGERRVISLLEAEEDTDLNACVMCFSLPTGPNPNQGTLEYDT